MPIACVYPPTLQFANVKDSFKSLRPVTQWGRFCLIGELSIRGLWSEVAVCSNNWMNLQVKVIYMLEWWVNVRYTVTIYCRYNNKNTSLLVYTYINPELNADSFTAHRKAPFAKWIVTWFCSRFWKIKYLRILLEVNLL